MELIFSLINEAPTLFRPSDLLGWLGWICLLGGIVFILLRCQKYQRRFKPNQWVLFGVLFVFVPLTSLFVGVRLPAGGALPLPGVALEPVGPTLMIFAALPFVLAAGLLGPIPAIVLGVISGVFLAYWNTHSIFTPLEMALLALLFSAAFGQNYRTILYRGLRHPLVTALLLSVLYPVLLTINALLLASGPLAGRIDYAITVVGPASAAIAGTLILAGMFAELVKLALPKAWGGQPPWSPSPMESSLEARFLYNVLPLAGLLVLVLLAGNWFVAGNAARQMLEERMANATRMAVDGVPYFLDAGQSLILQLASDQRLDLKSPARLDDFLKQGLRIVPFFRQLFILDSSKTTIAGYPIDNFDLVPSIPEEQIGIDLALEGVLLQVYTIPPPEGETTAQVSFLAAIVNEEGTSQGILIGRTDLESNPFTKPILTSLQSMDQIGGVGILLDESGQILYHPDSDLLMTSYLGRIEDQEIYYDETAPDGTRQIVYFQPAVGRPWAAVLTIPARRAQQLALNIAAPLVGMIVILSIVGVISLRYGLRVVTSSLKILAEEADRISQGQLDHSLSIEREDEVGHLRHSFEQMRLGLKARLDELNRLLLVSQGVASSLEMEEAVQPILESALVSGATSARVVLDPAMVPESRQEEVTTTQFGLGSDADGYHHLDDQILKLMSDRERMVITNPSRTPLLTFDQDDQLPASLVAVSLRHENQYYGTLWVGFDNLHSFAEDEVRFLTTLAGQAALAAANNRLFLNAEIGRQRLEAILASTPDPVLVTDYRDRILLVNPVAWQALGLGLELGIGKPIGEIISQPELVELLRASAEEQESVELTLSNGRIYLATASSVQAEGQLVGRVGVLRDITQFKELDALKSEFVSTVSHDLRSPLTLMRGYATMLEMVGDLNDQQANYVRKIIVGIESMSRLVNNLLDLGRIEADVGLQLQMVPVQDIIEQVTGVLSLQATQKRINLHVDIPQETPPVIEADQALLQQALQNLVENAIKYTPTRGDVWVSCSVRQGRMIFVIRDNGIGIAPVDQPRLFEKFYRGGSREAKREHGTGLGLAIVKSIAERHGGQVWLESQLGKGSTFYLAIPLRQNLGV
jgi:PAS domain S-box-containing protein